MSPNAKLSIAIAVVAAIAIGAIVVPKIDIGSDSPEDAEVKPTGPSGPVATELEQRAKPEAPKPPQDPDEVTGDQEISLTRPANLRRALAVLDKRRRQVEGVFDGLRVAPGRIDTTIETAKQRLTLQVRTDFKIGFNATTDFPNQPDFRKDGLEAEDVDVRAPVRIFERIDGVRKGSSAARDVDYVVIRRDIIDFKVNVSAFLRTGPAPRAFSLEPGEPFRAIG